MDPAKPDNQEHISKASKDATLKALEKFLTTPEDRQRFNELVRQEEDQRKTSLPKQRKTDSQSYTVVQEQSQRSVSKDSRYDLRAKTGRRYVVFPDVTQERNPVRGDYTNQDTEDQDTEKSEREEANADDSDDEDSVKIAATLRKAVQTYKEAKKLRDFVVPDQREKDAPSTSSTYEPTQEEIDDASSVDGPLSDDADDDAPPSDGDASEVEPEPEKYVDPLMEDTQKIVESYDNIKKLPNDWRLVANVLTDGMILRLHCVDKELKKRLVEAHGENKKALKQQLMENFKRIEGRFADDGNNRFIIVANEISYKSLSDWEKYLRNKEGLAICKMTVVIGKDDDQRETLLLTHFKKAYLTKAQKLQELKMNVRQRLCTRTQSSTERDVVSSVGSPSCVPDSLKSSVQDNLDALRDALDSVDSSAKDTPVEKN